MTKTNDPYDNEDVYTGDLAEPGENERGEPYNDLPTAYEDTPALDLGEDSEEFMEAEEPESPVESLPSYTDAAEEWERKFNKNGGAR